MVTDVGRRLEAVRCRAGQEGLFHGDLASLGGQARACPERSRRAPVAAWALLFHVELSPVAEAVFQLNRKFSGICVVGSSEGVALI
jgi:hypothetical protein